MPFSIDDQFDPNELVLSAQVFDVCAPAEAANLLTNEQVALDLGESISIRKRANWTLRPAAIDLPQGAQAQRINLCP